MMTPIIKIGNSKGIRIPKPLLEESDLGPTVEVKAKKGEIRITSIKSKPKKKIVLNAEYFLSLSTLSEWDDPEEDKAWESLQ